MFGDWLAAHWWVLLVVAAVALVLLFVAGAGDGNRGRGSTDDVLRDFQSAIASERARGLGPRGPAQTRGVLPMPAPQPKSTIAGGLPARGTLPTDAGGYGAPVLRQRLAADIGAAEHDGPGGLVRSRAYVHRPSRRTQVDDGLGAAALTVGAAAVAAAGIALCAGADDEPRTAPDASPSSDDGQSAGGTTGDDE